MGRELHGSVKAEGPRVGGTAKALHAGNKDLADTALPTKMPPDGRRAGRVRQQFDPVDQQQGATLDADVAPVPQQGFDLADEGLVIRVRMLLADQDIRLASVPTPTPVFIGPADAKRKIRLPGGQDLVQGTVKEALTPKPIIIIAKTIDPVA